MTHSFLGNEGDSRALFRMPQCRRYIDLFCGIGGFHIAAANLGLECVFASDIDAEARKVYRDNFGILPAGDITACRAEEIPSHDLLFGGFPCQPFSIIGDRRGFKDERNGGLFFEIIRIIRHHRPEAIVLENVKQLTTDDGGKTIRRIVSTLENLGYTVDWRVLNALKFGLPQRRERVLIIATQRPLKTFQWPSEDARMTPLNRILEDAPDPKHFVSERIRVARHKAHSTDQRPAIWHENKGGNVSSHPYSCALRAGGVLQLSVGGRRASLDAERAGKIAGISRHFPAASGG